MSAKAQSHSPKPQRDNRLRSIIEHVGSIDLVGNIRAIREAREALDGMLAGAEAELHGKGERSVVPLAARAVAANKTRREAAIRQGGSEKVIEGSAASWAADAIKRAGRPLTGPELVKSIEEHGHKVKPGTIAGSLYRWVKSKKVFYLAKPNTFGLIEMKKG